LLRNRPNTPSTIERAINTALPATPPRQRGYGDYSSPSRDGTDTDVELAHIRPYEQSQSHNSPFHDRHSIIVDAVDDLPEGWSPGSYKMKTVKGYKFAGMRDDDTKEELDFGDELQAPVYISEKRRSLYPTTPTIPLSTLHDHPDLQPNGDHIGGPDGIIPGYDAPIRHPRPPPVVPHFRRMLSLSSWQDICLLFIPGVLLAGATALVPPFMSIVIGDTFQVFSKFPIMTALATPEQRSALLEGVRYQTIRLSAAGLFAIVANYIKAVVWSWHGEVVAARLREQVYQGVQEKGMDWFDMGMGMRGDEEGEEAVGAGGLMTKFSKCVTLTYSIS
jgi:ATP-binding cassette subfamily B (MDR/TAP) protein 1